MPPAAGFAPLPFPETDAGASRKTGVEIEFSGLDIVATCQTIQDTLGGDMTGEDPFFRQVVNTAIGDIKVELDTPVRAASDVALVRKGLDVATAVVPLEVISEPLDTKGLADLDRLVDALRHAGAAGSRSGLFLGFGVHLNPEVVSVSHPQTLATIRAFALLEDYLRKREALDLTRRALPFVAPWPEGFVTDILQPHVRSLKDVYPIAAEHIQSRNHGLDLLPLLKYAYPDLFDLHLTTAKTAARPTFHFRMPDCRIDEPDWGLTQPWALWRLVECVAADDRTMTDLTDAWQQRPGGMFRDQAWREDVAQILTRHKAGEAA